MLAEKDDAGPPAVDIEPWTPVLRTLLEFDERTDASGTPVDVCFRFDMCISVRVHVRGATVWRRSFLVINPTKNGEKMDEFARGD